MRIIGGKFKSKRFKAPKHITARPTTDFAKEALSFFPHKFDSRNPHRKNIEIVWQNYSQPVELLPENYGADVSKNIVAEIEKYLETDVTAEERKYFQTKIEKFKSAVPVTDKKSKEDLARFINKNEKLFDNIGHLRKLWPEFSFLTD